MMFTSSLKFNSINEKLGFLSDTFSMNNLSKLLLIYAFAMHLFFIPLIYYLNYPVLDFSYTNPKTSHDLNAHRITISDVVFGVFGSEKAMHQRRSYVESWWRPSSTRGYIFLDEPPKGDLLPWSSSSPPYRVSDNFTKSFVELHHSIPVPIRIVHGIKEVFKAVNGDFRWLVLGDDDSVFLVDNLVDVLAEYDHTKYYYIGGKSEFLRSNHNLSFDQVFGGGGVVFSYPLAKALTQDIENCLGKYSNLGWSDELIKKCTADIGVGLSPHKGFHQIDLQGDISGFLSAHPQAPFISIHHLDIIDPIFPSKNQYESIPHLMKAASFDQPRMLQQTVCYYRQSNWSLSISWGYSVQLYESVLPRSLLHIPIETFDKLFGRQLPPHYMFNTRNVSTHPCEDPHVFFLESVEKTSSSEIRTVYSRAYPRGIPACSLNGNYSADYVSRIEVFSPTTKPAKTGRCECCDIVKNVSGAETVEVRFRQCRMDEIIA